MKTAVSKMSKTAFIGFCIAFSNVAVVPALADDERTPLLVTDGQRDFILLEMRTFLETVQGILTAVTEGDMETISEIAKSMGMSEAGKTPPDIVAILPEEFKMLAGATHNGFDQIAVEAQDMGDADAIIAQLGEMMQYCTACHATFRMDLSD